MGVGVGVGVGAMAMLPVAENVPVPGSYSSAEARKPMLLWPPVTNTLPLGSSVAVWPVRAVAMLPVEEKPPVAGSYSSAEAV